MKEPESDALVARLEAIALVTSELVETELRRVAMRAGGNDARALRSLDAIHLATAISLGPDVTGFVCYDQSLGAAAAARGLEVVAPS